MELGGTHENPLYAKMGHYGYSHIETSSNTLLGHEAIHPVRTVVDPFTFPLYEGATLHLQVDWVLI